MGKTTVRRTCAGLLSFMILAGGIAIGSECPQMSTEEALDAVRRTYMDGFNDGDVDAVMEIHTADTVHLPAGMEAVAGREAVRELMEQSASMMPDDVEFRFEPVDVRIAEDFAVERGVTAGSDRFPSGKYVLLYVKEDDGCWRIAWTITNSDAPPPGGE